MMSSKTCPALMLSLCLLTQSLITPAQEKAKEQAKTPGAQTETKAPAPAQKTQTISTTPKTLTSKLQTSDGKPIEVRGQATFTISKMNPDDSLVGIIAYTIPDKSRKKLSAQLGQPLSALPASIKTKEMSVSFVQETHCPEIRFAFAPMELEFARTKLHFDHFTLTLDESSQELSKLFCMWTQMSVSRHQQARGVIARIRVLLNGEEAEEGNDKKL